MEGSATVSRASEAADDGEKVEIALDALHTLTQATLATFGYSDEDAAAIAEVVASYWRTASSILHVPGDRASLEFTCARPQADWS